MRSPKRALSVRLHFFILFIKTRGQCILSCWLFRLFEYLLFQSSDMNINCLFYFIAQISATSSPRWTATWTCWICPGIKSGKKEPLCCPLFFPPILLFLIWISLRITSATLEGSALWKVWNITSACRSLMCHRTTLRMALASWWHRYVAFYLLFIIHVCGDRVSNRIRFPSFLRLYCNNLTFVLLRLSGVEGPQDTHELRSDV